MTQPAVITAAQLRALKRAARRNSGNLHPMTDVFGDAARLLEEALIRRGFVTASSNPVITPEGRQVLDQIRGVYR